MTGSVPCWSTQRAATAPTPPAGPTGARSRHATSTRSLGVAAAAALAALAGLSSLRRAGRPPGPPGPAPLGVRRPAAGSKVTGTVTVFAAASLKEAFTTLGQQFEAAHPGTQVAFNFGPSSALATQITQGAPGRRVRLGQHEEHGRRSSTPGAAAAPTDLREERDGDRRPAGQPGAASPRLADLARPGVKVALCQPQVPVRRRGGEGVRRRRGARCSPVTQEEDVKSVARQGARWARSTPALVYVTDVKAAGGKVKGIADPRGRQRRRRPTRSPR